TMFALQEIRHPKQVEPPDRVGHELGYHKGPSLPMRNEAGPTDFHHWRLRVASDVLQLRLREARVLVWLAIQQQPEYEPDETQRAHNHKGPAPAPMDGDPGHDQGSNHRAEIRTGVENSRRQRALFFWKPLCYALDAGRKNCGFAETQCRSGKDETGQGTTQGVAHRGQTPENHGQGVAEASADAIDQPAHEQNANRVSRLERKHEIAVIDFIPAQIMLQSGLQDSEDLAVHVIFC